MQIIYLDVLLIFNLYMNYLLLSLTARITHIKLVFWRGLFGAGIGSLASFSLFLPEFPFFFSALFKFLTALLMCLSAFGKKRLFRNCTAFFGISFLVSGALYALSVCSQIHTVHQNGYFYFDISLSYLIGFTILAYLLLSVMQFLYDRNQIADRNYQVFIRYQADTALLDGLADTGNSLTDFYSGKPVIICDNSLLKNIQPEHSHILPYFTIAGSGTIKVFQPDEIIISSDCGTAKTVDALVGIGEQENGKAIFNPKLMRF